MTEDEKRQAEAASWRTWQTAWGNTESGAHAHGWANGYEVGFAAGRRSFEDDARHCADPYPAVDRLDQGWLTED